MQTIPDNTGESTLHLKKRTLMQNKKIND